MLRFLWKEEGVYTLLEVHEGISVQHLGAIVLAKNILRARYFWPTMVRDTEEYMRMCDQCQQHGDVFDAPSTEFYVLTSP